MGRRALALLMGALVSGLSCASVPVAEGPPPARTFPDEALVTQRAVFTARGREVAFNGYLALSASGAMRLVVTQSFGQVVADVLVEPGGRTHAIRGSSILRPEWVERFVAADLLCLFGRDPPEPCPAWQEGSDAFVVARRRYRLEVQVLRTDPGAQPQYLFVPPDRPRS